MVWTGFCNFSVIFFSVLRVAGFCEFSASLSDVEPHNRQHKIASEDEVLEKLDRGLICETMRAGVCEEADWRSDNSKISCALILS